MTEYHDWRAESAWGHVATIPVVDGQVEITPEALWGLYQARADTSSLEGSHVLTFDEEQFLCWLEGMGYT